MIKKTVTRPTGINDKGFVVLGKPGLKLCFNPVFFRSFGFFHIQQKGMNGFSVLLPQGYKCKNFLFATNMFTREGFFTCEKILPFTSHKDGNV